jgi:hypothetical protein
MKQNLLTVLEGGTPERTPLSIYDWNLGATDPDTLATRMADPDWARLFDLGLLVSHHCEIVEIIEHGVETTTEERKDGGDILRITRKTTPVGEVRKVTRNGWHEEDWIKEPEDYRTWRWIVENSELEPHYERYERAESAVGNRGVVILTGAGNWTHRTPAMKINVDLAGTEQFCMDVACEVAELFDLYGALKKQFLSEQRLIAAGPGRYVKWLENLTVSMLGPQRYRDLLMPVYREGVPILEAGGKRVMVHYDGALDIIADQIAGAPFHMVESLTEPPEGDMRYEDCRAAWPDKVLWANINIGLYAEPEDVFREAVADKLRRAGVRAFAFELSEDIPPNWRERIPVILDALSRQPTLQ